MIAFFIILSRINIGLLIFLMLETFSADLAHLFTGAGVFALLNIILIDLVMSGDNAILIGMATKKLTGATRKKAIFW
jgi:predicted tellurium resistance membrane protein TerC